MAKKTVEEKVYKVAMSIPTEGHTLPEAYDNHLVNAQRVGGYEYIHKYENMIYKIRESIKSQTNYRKLLKRIPRLQKIKFKKVRYEFYWFTAARLLTQMARERLVRVARDGGMDFIVMYDDDMTLPPEFPFALLDDMQKHPEIDVVAALAFMRNPPHLAVLYNVIEGYDGVRHQPYYINHFVKHYPKNKLVEADAVGFGGVCIRMNMIAKMKEPYFMSTTNTGEDIFFCVKARKEAKARIFMDTRVKLGHLAKPVIVDEEYYEKYLKDTKYDLGPEVPNKYIRSNR